jgi:hypothetical protein
MDRKFLYLSGMLVPVIYIFMYILGGALRPGYNQIADSVSELLSPGAPNKSLLMIIQFAFAMLQIFFGYGVLRFIQESEHKATIGIIGAWLLIAVGVATIGTTIFPQDATGTEATLPGKIHIILVFAVLLPGALLSTLLIGFWFKKAGIFPGFATYSFITVGAIVLSGVAAGPSMGTQYMGLVERISALVVHQWLFIFALKLFRT